MAIKNKMCCDCGINQACDNAYPSTPPCAGDYLLKEQIRDLQEEMSRFVGGDSKYTWVYFMNKLRTLSE